MQEALHCACQESICARFKPALDVFSQLSADNVHTLCTQVRKTYGVKKDLLGLLEGRQTYVIGKDGIVKLVFNNQWEPEKHVDEALKALA